MVMALAGNKADLVEARKVAAEASLSIFAWFTSLFSILYAVKVLWVHEIYLVNLENKCKIRNHLNSFLSLLNFSSIIYLFTSSISQ